MGGVTFSSRSLQQNSMHQGGKGGKGGIQHEMEEVIIIIKNTKEGLTNCDNSSHWITLVIELKIHVFSLRWTESGFTQGSNIKKPESSLTKRDELSLRVVLAFPKAAEGMVKVSVEGLGFLSGAGGERGKPSRMGFEFRRESFTRSTCSLLPLTAAMYFITIFEASVFPAPLSPVIKIH
jgi:hypothetical protein